MFAVRVSMHAYQLRKGIMCGAKPYQMMIFPLCFCFPHTVASGCAVILIAFLAGFLYWRRLNKDESWKISNSDLKQQVSTTVVLHFSDGLVVLSAQSTWQEMLAS